MTTIAAKRTPAGKVQIAWDAQTTSGNTATKNALKVRRINQQFAVGISGHLRYANIIHQASVDRIHRADIVDPDFDAEAWLITVLVPAWGSALQKASELFPDDDSFGRCLVVLGGKIFEVGFDMSVMNLGDYGAIGSGGMFAVTAMHLGKSAKKAVEVAAELDLYTGGEVKELTL